MFLSKKNIEKRKRYLKELKSNFSKNHRLTSILYLVLIFFVLVVLVIQAVQNEYENCFTCVLTLILFSVPVFLERTMKITLPNTLEVIIVLFIFCAEILGEIQGFYLKFQWWDTMLHTLNGFLMAGVGVSMIDIFNRSERFKFELSPFFVALVAFCFSMTIGVLWEFFEFMMDVLTQTDMQKDTVLNTISSVALNPLSNNVPIVICGIDQVALQGSSMTVNEISKNTASLNMQGYLDIGLIDTMTDLWVNFIGAIIFSVIGFFYCRSQGKRPFAQRFIPKLKSEGKEIESNEA